MDDDQLVQLQRWYAERCDGEWERQHGIEISTLDNPGWSVKISLKNTDLEQRAFDRVRGRSHRGRLVTRLD